MSQVLDEAEQDLQITGSYLNGWNGKIKKADGYCAMGLLSCACDNIATNGMFKVNEQMFLHQKYGISSIKLDELHDCPECKRKNKTLGFEIVTLIIHLNDKHDYTYKQIAEYLKTKEL